MDKCNSVEKSSLMVYMNQRQRLVQEYNERGENPEHHLHFYKRLSNRGRQFRVLMKCDE